MELKLNKKYECIRKSNGELICTIHVMSLTWLDTKSDRNLYCYDRNLLDMGKYVFRDVEHRTDIFELRFEHNLVYVKWLCKDFEIKEMVVE